MLSLSRCIGLMIIFTCLGLGTIPAVQAQTALSGQYNNNPNPPGDGNGYDALGGSYLVAGATFSNNGTGMVARNSTVTVNGGTFSNNANGLYATISTVTVNGGTFSNRGSGLSATSSSTVTVSGGTFNGNAIGLGVSGDSTVTVSGGTFSNSSAGGFGMSVGDYSSGAVIGGTFSNNYDGLNLADSSVTVSGGTFSNNADSGLFASTSQVSVNGGTFSGNKFGLYANMGTVTVSGGTFSGNAVADFYLASVGGSFDVYGTFDGLSVGQTETLICTSAVQSFHGQLKYANAPQTFTYTGDGGDAGTITLHDVVPPGKLTLYDAGYYASHTDLSDSTIGPINISTLMSDSHVCTGAVADGATKVLLRYNADSAGTVTFTETNGVTGVNGDNLRMVTSTQAPTNVATQLINGQNVAFAVYTVPESLDNTPEAVPSHATKHPVYFQAIFTPMGGTVELTVPGSLILQSPPVLLMHGLWSSSSTWSLGNGTLEALGAGQFTPYPLDYSTTNVASFATNQMTLWSDQNGFGIKKVYDQYRSQQIAITKVDVVGHSMGGLLTLDFASLPDYISDDNFHSGYVRRLITLGTPHSGSALAADLKALHTSSVGSSVDYLLARTDHPYGLAIEDLSPGSPELLALKADPIPCYAEVGNYSTQSFSDLTSLYNLLLFFAFNYHYEGLPSFGNLDAFLFSGEDNDMIVSVSSQEGGLTTPWFNITGFTNHFQETSNDTMGEDVARLLAGPLSNFYPDGFPTSVVSPTSSHAPLIPLATIPLQQPAPFISITAPTAGQVFHPGDTLSVAITPNSSTMLAQVLIVAGASQQPIGSALLTASPFTASFTIPTTYLGDLPITIAAQDNAGNLCTVDADTTVQTSATVSSLTVAAATIAPLGPALLTSLGSTNPLSVTGTFSDGVLRDVTLGALGTTYVSGDPTIATVSAGGLLTAVANGSCTITITNGSATATENVIVQLGTPNIFSVAPSSAASGAIASLALTGTDFGGATLVQFLLNGIPDPNITVTNIQNDTLGVNLTATMTIGATAVPGLRTVVVTTPDGASDPLAAPDAAGFTITPPPIATTTGLASSLNPSASGQSVTFTASVTGGTGTPTGVVTFTVDGAAQMPVTLDGSGDAILTTSALTVGSHSITAAYGGDSTFALSTSSALTQTVAAIPTAFAVANASTSYYQTLTLTATLARSDTGAALSGEMVTFKTDNLTVGTAVTSASGVATLSYPLAGGLAVGSHTLTASFAGDASFAASSGTGTLTVTKVNATVTVAPVSGSVGQTITLSATLSKSGGSALSSKTLSFKVDNTVAGTAVTSSTGVANLTYTIPSSTSTGSHTITVSFAGDSADNASSGTGTLTVSVASSANQVRYWPQSSYPQRMVGGLFQGSSDDSTWTTLATVSQTPPINQWSSLPASADPATYRYLRYLAPSGSYGNVAEIEFDSHGTKLTGTGFGTAGSYNNDGYTYANALDGNTSTYFNAPAPGNGDYVGIDRGAASAVNQVRYYPCVGKESRMVGGQFQGSSDNSNWATLYTVTTAPSDAWTSATVTTDPATYRYLRYLAPSGSYGNVAEIEFDSHGTKLTGTGFGTAGSYNNDGYTYANALDGNTSTYFNAPAPGNGDYVGIDLGASGAAVVTRIGYCPASAHPQRMVGGIFQGSNDDSSWTALYTVTSAPPTGSLTEITAISSGTAYRYLRYLAPSGSYGNVAEIEFDTSP